MVLVYIFGALLGLCVGSFLNVVIYRLPNNMNLAFPPSHCPKCNYQLKWYDNIPVISYCILGGKCRNCKEPISFRYTAVEIINTLMWVGCIALFWEKSIPYACIAALSCSVLLCMFFTDLEHRIVPDSLQIILGALGIASIFFDTNIMWYSHLIGSAATGMVFFIVSIVAEKVLGKEALGGGDIKLAFAAGMLLGWEKMLAAMLVATVAGSIVLLILQKVKNKERGTEYPFVPFMVSGIVIMLFAGDGIIAWYTRLLQSFII